ncbi:MAG: DUF1569 domain-containing protein [Candidatus Cloacimonetes bacterium]|nr:DUF1569 domain-containing protein [Candidatus Cloacimonadota bacterium]
MADLNQSLAENRRILRELLDTIRACETNWNQPAAPGKWSPAQITEHLARSLEESALVVRGTKNSFPVLPAFLRPVIRLFFLRILRKERLPRARTSRAFNPVTGSATAAAGAARLEAALLTLEQDCRTRVAGGLQVHSGIFGTVGVGDFARFQGLHMRHHHAQYTRIL